MTMSECRKFDKINNCVAYGYYANIGTPANNDRVRYGCKLCSNNYYLNPDANFLFTVPNNGGFISDKCIVRTYLDNNCLLYMTKEDKCQTCAYGYYLDATSGKCKQSPSGILNCLTYQNGNTCLACQGDFYLINNSCLAVTTPVTNCSNYKTDSICATCNAGSYIDPAQNKCITNTVTNCVV